MSELRNEAGTPQALFDVWNEEYGFTVDICASAHNAKLAAHLTTEDNSLGLHWGGLRVWCNPPYVDIPAWLAHAHEALMSCYLLPARTDRSWWQEWKSQAECHYIVGQKPECRPQFVTPPGITYSSNPMSLVLFCFGEGTLAGREVWRSGLTGERLPR